MKVDVGQKMIMKQAVIALMLTLLAVPPSSATITMKYQATVLDVIDGDTIQVGPKRDRFGVTYNPEGPVEIDGIDAPEIDQPGGEEAKQFLVELLKGKTVQVVELVDMGKSFGAWVTLDRKSINLLLVQNGHAWLSTITEDSHRSSRAELVKALAEAKEKKVGIWKQENPVDPAEWRKRQKERTANKTSEPSVAPASQVKR